MAQQITIAKDMVQNLSSYLRGRMYHQFDIMQAAKVAEKVTFAVLKQPAPQCPCFPATLVRVINVDSITAALQLPLLKDAAPPLVMSFANESMPGGGWKSGATAQEEALFYRSSLSMSLASELYPILDTEGIYSPVVAVLRDDTTNQYAFLSLDDVPAAPPAVSVMSICAPRNPATKTMRWSRAARKGNNKLYGTYDAYAKKDDRNRVKEKMRLVLSMAAARGHTRLVLGAFGCGVYQNPPFDVALCWREVLCENLGHGNPKEHWWDDVIFAVFGGEEDVNFQAFKAVFSEMYV